MIQTCRSLILILVFVLTACSPSDSEQIPDDTINPDQPIEKPLPTSAAEGFIQGEPWKFRSGRAIIFQSGRRPVLEVVAYSTSLEDPCEARTGFTTVVRMLVTPEEDLFTIGKDPFDIYPNLFFIDPSKFRGDPRYSLAANNGRIQVVAIRRDVVIVRVEAAYTGPGNLGRTEVSGQIAVPLCGSSRYTLGTQLE